MADFSSNISALASVLGVEFDTLDRAVRALESSGATRQQAIDSLSLSLTDLQTQVNSLNLSAIIDDTVTDPTKVWSSTKVTAAIAAAKDSILGGAGAAYDTLLELQNLITANGGSVVDILSAQAKRVAVDVAQNFTAAEQDQGRANIGAMSLAAFDAYKLLVGDLTTDFVTVFRDARVAAASV